MFVVAFLSPVKGSNAVKLLSYGGFLEIRCYSAIMLSLNVAPSRVYLQKRYSGWGLFEEGLFVGGGLFKDLRYIP